jgi:hypothetical protein
MAFGNDIESAAAVPAQLSRQMPNNLNVAAKPTRMDNRVGGRASAEI